MLRTRLLLNLLPFVVILLATGVYALVLFSRLATNVDRSVTEHYRSVVSAQQMMSSLTGIERDAWAASVPGHPANRRAAAESRKQFEEHLALQLKNVSIPGESVLNEKLAAKYRAFSAAADSLESVKTPEARLRIYDQQITPNLLLMKRILEEILDVNQRAILSTNTSVRRITEEVRRLMVIGMLIALAIFAHAYFQISRSVIRPIQTVTDATRELGEGNLKRPVPVVSRDELGELARAFNKMAAQLQEYRQSTTEEIVRLHHTMETTLGSFPDPIFVLNPKGGIELKNPAADDFLRHLGGSGPLPERLQALTQKVLQSGENFLPHTFDGVVSYRLSGVEKFYLPRVLTMRDKEGSLFGVALVLYDVTRFRLLDSAKTHLVGTVSHELKTPLTSVRMVLHILLEKTLGALTPKQEDLLLTARNDTERLLRILENLLDLARLEGGEAELHREAVAPADLLRPALDETADLASTRGLKVNCSLEPNLPRVSVDPARIGHVFTNLLSNAIKHSPPGGQIRIGVARAEDGWVAFVVTDEGPGIPEEYHARIFDRFFRVPGQGKTGAGLGLSIAREITLAHGGRIGLRSSPGHGAAFYLMLRSAETTS